MDIHQKISIGIFGTLLLGTLAMYGTGGLSSDALQSNTLENANSPCGDTFMADYAKIYPTDKEKITEIQKFLRQNCGEKVVEAKQSYCEARTKQLETYSGLVKKYEMCLNAPPTLDATQGVTR